MNKRTRRIIQEINDSVPQELRSALFKEVYVAPGLRLEARRNAKAMRKDAEALPEGGEREIALRSVQRLQNIIDAGHYDTKELRVDKEVAAKIDAWVDAELDKAIKDGRIPHPKDDKQHNSYQRKLKQHEQRKRKEAGLDLLGSQAQPVDQAGSSEAN